MAVAGVYVPLSTRDIQNIKIPTKFTYLQLVHAKAALTVTDHYGRKKVPEIVIDVKFRTFQKFLYWNGKLHLIQGIDLKFSQSESSIIDQLK